MRSKEAVERRAKKRGISVQEMWKLENANVKKGVERENKQRKLEATASGPTTEKVKSHPVGKEKDEIDNKDEKDIKKKDGLVNIVVKNVAKDVKHNHESDGSVDDGSVSSSSSSFFMSDNLPQ